MLFGIVSSAFRRFILLSLGPRISTSFPFANTMHGQGEFSLFKLHYLVVFTPNLVYDKDYMSALWVKNTSESDPRSYKF